MAGLGDVPALDNRFGLPVVKDGCGVFGVLRKLNSPMISSLVALNGVSCVKYRGSDLGAGYAAFVSPSGDGDRQRFRIQAFVKSEGVAESMRRVLEDEVGTIEEQRLRKPDGASGRPRLGVWEATLRLRSGGTETLLETAVDRINQTLLDGSFEGRVFSYGQYLRVYKEVGYPGDVARLWGLGDNAEAADMWLAHTRQPTNSPGSLPIWSHPFASMNTAIVHNGDISSFGANMELLKSWKLMSHVGTDSEVIARLLDHLVRVEGLSITEAATVLTNPSERTLPKELLKLLWRYRGARLDGPFAVVAGYADQDDVYLLALSDRSKFRPLLIGEDENCFYVASEENQIRNQSPDAKIWTPEPGSFFVASVKKGIIAAGTERPTDTQTSALGTTGSKRRPNRGFPVIDARGMEFSGINDAIAETLGRRMGGIGIENCAGQRYIGIGISPRKDGRSAPFKIEVTGYPGNCLANLNDGASFEVYGNAADDLADTMHAGSVIVHGNARDVVGQALQGGHVLVRGSVGNRAAIQMREYKHEKPFLVVGETADDYLGEYMAGGVAVVLNLGGSQKPARNFVGTGMVGGRIYIRGRVDEAQIGLPPRREDLLSYLRACETDGQISRKDYEELAKAEHLTIELLSKHLPESALSRLSFLFFSSRYTKTIMVERRRLNEEDRRLIRDSLREFFSSFRLPDRLLKEVMSSEFTIIRTKDDKPEQALPPQEVLVEE